MKKLLLLAAGAALVLSSCSNDDEVYTPVNNNREIGFRSFIDKGNGTRAAITNTDNILNFTVTGWWDANNTTWAGYNSPVAEEYLFNATDISRRESAGYTDWTYAPTKYWPTGGNGVYFFAYSPAASRNVSSGVYEYVNTSLLKYTVPDPDPTFTKVQEDFLLAQTGLLDNTSSSVYSSPVQMNFVHALSRVKFWAASTTPGITYTISKVELVNVYKTADIDLTEIPDDGILSYLDDGLATSGTVIWDNPADMGDVTIDMGSAPAYLTTKYESLLGETGALMVMPQETTYGLTPLAPGANEFYLAVTYSAFQGDFYYVKDERRLFPVMNPLAAAGSEVPLTFEMGRQYNFRLTLGDDVGGEIRFDVNVSNWTDTPPVYVPELDDYTSLLSPYLLAAPEITSLVAGGLTRAELNSVDKLTLVATDFLDLLTGNEYEFADDNVLKGIEYLDGLEELVILSYTGAVKEITVVDGTLDLSRITSTKLAKITIGSRDASNSAHYHPLTFGGLIDLGDRFVDRPVTIKLINTRAYIDCSNTSANMANIMFDTSEATSSTNGYAYYLYNGTEILASDSSDFMYYTGFPAKTF